MQTVKVQYEAHVSGLQEQLDWHKQRQADSDALLREQEATITDLQARVREVPTVQAAQQQVADLQRRVRCCASLGGSSFACLVRQLN